MEKLYYYPIKEHFLNQAWGILRPEIYSRFGFTRHNGLDHRLAPDRKIYAPCNATVLLTGNEPSGGGIYVALLTGRQDFEAFICTTPDGAKIPFPAGTFHVRIDFLHLEKVLVKTGDVLEAGDLMAIGDNTGFSTGPHCHTQWRRVTWDGTYAKAADRNDANNSFDPTQFFNRFYAVDAKKVLSFYEQLVAALKRILEIRSA